MSVVCSGCGRVAYDDNPKHTISGDCITGFDADSGDPMVLCWGCYPAEYVMIRDESGLNKFRGVD